eukprot:TRINITY_DN4073_c0_g1_i1.p2 TRINITY_DN4073_c0_g1~~TRINITY_DN4073_c0_g1_i1.p2  ORF type:complete len:161 (+),score=75.37 TRINITY_DN4073_c0_g1_i1:69-485(+)
MKESDIGVEDDVEGTVEKGKKERGDTLHDAKLIDGDNVRDGERSVGVAVVAVEDVAVVVDVDDDGDDDAVEDEEKDEDDRDGVEEEEEEVEEEEEEEEENDVDDRDDMEGVEWSGDEDEHSVVVVVEEGEWRILSTLP